MLWTKFHGVISLFVFLKFKTSTKELISIPHDKMALRNFVLFPLKEICPNWMHPHTGIHIDKLIDKLPDVDKKSILKVQRT